MPERNRRQSTWEELQRDRVRDGRRRDEEAIEDDWSAEDSRPERPRHIPAGAPDTTYGTARVQDRRNPIFPRPGQESLHGYQVTRGPAPAPRGAAPRSESIGQHASDVEEPPHRDRTTSDSRPTRKYPHDQKKVTEVASSRYDQRQQNSSQPPITRVQGSESRPSHEFNRQQPRQATIVQPSDVRRPIEGTLSTSPATIALREDPFRIRPVEGFSAGPGSVLDTSGITFSPVTTRFPTSGQTRDRDVQAASPAITRIPSNTTTIGTQDQGRDPPRFSPNLDVDLQPFANLPRGRFANVATYLRRNPQLLGADPGPLLDAAVRAYTYANTYGVTPLGDKKMFGDCCIQQYVILKVLQIKVAAGRRERATAEIVEQFFRQLLDENSPTREHHYKEFTKQQLYVKTQSQTRRAEGEALVAPERVQIARTYSDVQHDPISRLPQPTNALDFGKLAISGGGSHVNDLSVPKPKEPDAITSLATHQKISTPQAREGLSYSALTDSAAEATPRFSVPGNLTLRRESQKLDQRYIKRDSSFYKVGKVFAVLWHENFSDTAGEAYIPSGQTNFSVKRLSTGKFGEPIYSSIRRMVVVRADHGFCVCIQINSYGNRGLSKFRNSPVDVEAHSRIYMSGTQAEWLPDEPQSSKRDIAVKEASRDQRLNQTSRVCYSRPHTVEHTVKSMDVGSVTEKSLPYLRAYFQHLNNLKQAGEQE